jgi:hypothetical protein
LTETTENVLRVKLDEGLAEDDGHLIDVAGVCPVRVVDGGESDLALWEERKVSNGGAGEKGKERERTRQANAVIIICVASRE